MNSRKVILYIAMSLDGYIADTNENLDFLSVVEQAGEDYGYAEFNKRVDTIILGRKTYDKVLKMGHDYGQLHSDKQVFVITRTAAPAQENVQFYTDDLTTLIQTLKQQKGKDIYCDGGAEIVHILLKNNLIDEFIISIIPILLGGGIALFKQDRSQLRLELCRTQSFPTGLVQLHYVKKITV